MVRSWLSPRSEFHRLLTIGLFDIPLVIAQPLIRLDITVLQTVINNYLTSHSAPFPVHFPQTVPSLPSSFVSHGTHPVLTTRPTTLVVPTTLP